MELQKEIFNGYKIYFYEDKYREIGVRILKKQYQEGKRFKDSIRNLVMEINMDGRKYILKEPRNENRLWRKKWMTCFKKGEALTTLIQVNHVVEECKEAYIKPYVAIIQRKKGIITYSCFLTEFSEGIMERKYFDDVVEMMKKVHSFGYYHGDCNPSNFLIERKKDKVFVRILDTQANQMVFSKYRAHYDMLTMQLDSYQEMKYPYEKDISYYFAFGMKQFKKLKQLRFWKKKT